MKASKKGVLPVVEAVRVSPRGCAVEVEAALADIGAVTVSQAHSKFLHLQQVGWRNQLEGTLRGSQLHLPAPPG